MSGPLVCGFANDASHANWVLAAMQARWEWAEMTMGGGCVVDEAIVSVHDTRASATSTVN